MAKYLGETKVDIKTHPVFKKYTTVDWMMYFIESYGQIDGEHHKTWVLDQAARIAHGNKIEVKLAKWDDGQSEYRVNLVKAPTKEYKNWVKEMKDGEDGPESYSYDEGIAP